MVRIPDGQPDHTTAGAILKWYGDQDEHARLHLGCSEIGGPCDRQLWYGFRWVSKPEISGRLRRLFQTGNLAEARFVSDLRAIGATVDEVDPASGEQWYWATHGGHFGGSCDGQGSGFPEGPKTIAVVEFKTHSAKSFAALVKDKVQKSKPTHWAQMQCYMMFAKRDRALYVAVNKDTDALYSEWVHYDKAAAAGFVDRARRVIEAKVPLTAISDDFTWWQCKMCNHFGVCHSNKVADKNCRTCAYSTPVMDIPQGVAGGWMCERYNRALLIEEQRVGCRGHLFIPALVPYAEPQDGGVEWVGYRHKANGSMFANITEDCTREDVPAEYVAGYTSEELVISNASTIADGLVGAIKDRFWGAKIMPYDNSDVMRIVPLTELPQEFIEEEEP